MRRVFDVENALARKDEAARDDLRVNFTRNRAIVSCVPLQPEHRVGIVLLGAGASSLLVHREPDVRYDVRMPYDVDVDDPCRADIVRRVVARIALREFVDLEEIVVPVDRYRDRHLWDRHVGPREPCHSHGLGIGRATLDRADVEDDQAREAEVRDV